jgi:hypothetical protein
VEIMLRLSGILWSAALSAAVLATPAVALAAPQPPAPAYATAIQSWSTAPTGRVLVRVGAEFDAAAFAAAVQADHGHTVSARKGLDRLVVDLPGGADGAAAADVRAVPGVRDLSAFPAGRASGRA